MEPLFEVTVTITEVHVISAKDGLEATRKLDTSEPKFKSFYNHHWKEINRPKEQ